MRLLWLPEVLRRAGLTVYEYEGWRTRGSDTFGPVIGGICHGTNGSMTSTDEGELRTIAITGSNTATPPISQLYLSRSGAVWVVASGTCTGVKTGTAGPLKGYSDDSVLQVEAQHHKDEPWSSVQYWAYVRLWAALCAFEAPGFDIPVERVVGHYEHQPTEKTDPWFDMYVFRRDVAKMMEDNDMSLSDERLQLPATQLKTGAKAPAQGDVEHVDGATALAYALRHAWRGGEYGEANYDMLQAIAPIIQQLPVLLQQINETNRALQAALETLSRIQLTDEQLATLARQTGGQVAGALGALRFEPRMPQ